MSVFAVRLPTSTTRRPSLVRPPAPCILQSPTCPSPFDNMTASSTLPSATPAASPTASSACPPFLFRPFDRLLRRPGLYITTGVPCDACGPLLTSKLLQFSSRTLYPFRLFYLYQCGSEHFLRAKICIRLYLSKCPPESEVYSQEDTHLSTSQKLLLIPYTKF